mgnify:CR=1 FL=1
MSWFKQNWLIILSTFLLLSFILYLRFSLFIFLALVILLLFYFLEKKPSNRLTILSILIALLIFTFQKEQDSNKIVDALNFENQNNLILYNSLQEGKDKKLVYDFYLRKFLSTNSKQYPSYNLRNNSKECFKIYGEYIKNIEAANDLIFFINQKRMSEEEGSLRSKDSSLYNNLFRLNDWIGLNIKDLKEKNCI